MYDNVIRIDNILYFVIFRNEFVKKLKGFGMKPGYHPVYNRSLKRFRMEEPFGSASRISFGTNAGTSGISMTRKQIGKSGAGPLSKKPNINSQVTAPLTGISSSASGAIDKTPPKATTPDGGDLDDDKMPPSAITPDALTASVVDNNTPPKETMPVCETDSGVDDFGAPETPPKETMPVCKTGSGVDDFGAAETPPKAIIPISEADSGASGAGETPPKATLPVSEPVSVPVSEPISDPVSEPVCDAGSFIDCNMPEATAPVAKPVKRKRALKRKRIEVVTVTSDRILRKR